MLWLTLPFPLLSFIVAFSYCIYMRCEKSSIEKDMRWQKIFRLHWMRLVIIFYRVPMLVCFYFLMLNTKTQYNSFIHPICRQRKWGSHDLIYPDYFCWINILHIYIIHYTYIYFKHEIIIRDDFMNVVSLAWHCRHCLDGSSSNDI